MKNSWNTLPTLVAVSVLAAINPAYAQDSQAANEKAIEVSAKTKEITNTTEIDKTKEIANTRKVSAFEDETEIIEVTGLRSSLLRASELKRNANNLIDVINAEDVGNFPDENVVESLSRITGVQVIFGENGTAGAFQIRGVSENRVELNGRSVAGGAGGDPSRSINLADFPSELIDSLEVIKTPTAALTEGSLGATINLKTKRPLSVKNSFVSVNAKAKYGDEVDKVYPNLNIIGSHSWRDTALGDFGAIVNLTYNDNYNGGDTVQVNGWGNVCPRYKNDGAGFLNQDQSLCQEDDLTVYRPNNFVLVNRDAHNVKEAINLTLQWAPSDNSSYILDFIHTDNNNFSTDDVFKIQTQRNTMMLADRLNGEESLYAFSNIQLGNEVTRVDNMGRFVDTVVPVTSFDTQAGFFERSTAQANQNITKQTTIALKGLWDFDRLGIQAEVATSTSDVERHYVAVGYNHYGNNPTDLRDHRRRVDGDDVWNTEDALAVRQTGADISFDLSDDRTVGIDVMSGLDPNDLRSYRVTGFRDDGWLRESGTSSAKVDFDYFLDWGPLESIQFGARFARDVTENTSRYRFVCDGRWGGYNADGPNDNVYDENVHDDCEEPISAVELAERYPGSNTTHSGFYDKASNVPSWSALDLTMFRDNRALWNEMSGFNDRGYEESQGENYTMTEDTSAIYVMGNFTGDVTDTITYRGNAGVRAVRTEITSETYNALGADGLPIPGYLESSYDNMLPSINIAFAHEDYGLVRLAAARVMVRPAIAKLLPVAQLNNFHSCAPFNPLDPYGVLNGNTTLDLNTTPLTQEQQDHWTAQLYAINHGYVGTTDTCPGIRSGTTNIGNMDLKAQTSDNFDLSLEHYWGEGNMVSLAFFYRNVQADFVTERDWLQVPAVPGSELLGVYGNLGGEESYLGGAVISAIPGYELWRTRVPLNGEGTTRKGIEVSYTQWLDFLPGAWNGLGFSLNYTYTEGTRPTPTFIDSNTEEYLDLSTMSGIPKHLVGDTIPTDFAGKLAIFDELAALGDDGPLANGFELLDPTVLLPIKNMSKHSGNFSMFYDKGPVNVRLAANYRSEYYRAGNLNNAQYQDAALRVDFSSSYRVTQKLRLQFNINNLTKTISHTYRIDEQLTDKTYYADRTFTLGMNYRF